MPVKGLLERLKAGENVIAAEGYLFEFERRGYLKAGSYTPDVVLEHPELVKVLSEEFVHAGSDVVLAFTYYAHREKLKLVGREEDLEKMNRKALQIARQVADETGTLMAGNICNTTVYKRDNPESQNKAKAMFKEQILWAVEEKADFILGETFCELGEAMLALKSIQEFGNGLPAVITVNCTQSDTMSDGVSYADGCKALEDAGAAVVGLNCGRGPRSILPVIKQVKAKCKGPVACLPAGYRTNEVNRAFQSLKDEITGEMSFPSDLPAHSIGRHDIIEFAQEAKKLGVQYVGICCGNASHYMRPLAEVYGRTPPASKYSPDLSLHFCFGDKEHFDPYYTDILKSNLTGDT